MSRYEELRLELGKQPDIEVVEGSPVSYRDERKGISYNERRITVVPKYGVVPELATFTTGLLPNFEPLYRHDAQNGVLTTFEGSKENGYDVTRIQVKTGIEK